MQIKKKGGGEGGKISILHLPKYLANRHHFSATSNDSGINGTKI